MLEFGMLGLAILLKTTGLLITGHWHRQLLEYVVYAQKEGKISKFSSKNLIQFFHKLFIAQSVHILL